MPIVTPGTFSNAALATELNNDPLGIGYPAVFANSDSLAVLLNTNPEPIAAGSQESINRRTTPTVDLISCIVAADYTALSATQRDLCALVFSTPITKTGDAAFRTLVASVFAAGTTRTALIAASSRLCSRAEALWGDGVYITGQTVAAALGR